MRHDLWLVMLMAHGSKTRYLQQEPSGTNRPALPMRMAHKEQATFCVCRCNKIKRFAAQPASPVGALSSSAQLKSRFWRDDLASAWTSTDCVVCDLVSSSTCVFHVSRALTANQSPKDDGLSLGRVRGDGRRGGGGGGGGTWTSPSWWDP